jgi:OPA family glycerol-3-phosphate transporter-like MFS transporter
MSFLGFGTQRNTTQDRLYKYWRFRMMLSMMVGYAAFYFLRTNLSFAMPQMEADLGFSKDQLGTIVSVFGIIYGFGKFISGIIGDRSKSRTFISVGLLLAAISNILMGTASSLWLLLAVWALNSCCQSTGAPSCAKMLAHWFSSKEIGTYWAVWSSSQQIGAAIVGVTLPYLLVAHSWRFAFWVPGVLCAFVAAFIYWGLRDSPEAVDLPKVEVFEGLSTKDDDECAHMTSFQILVKRVLRSKMVWAMCPANFFIYFVRMGLFYWAPMFLVQLKGCSPILSGRLVTIFNIAGAFGAVAAGVLSDRFFKGRRGRAGFLYMIGLSLSMLAILKMPVGMGWVSSELLPSIVMFLIGFFVAGPQTMVGVAAVDIASKRAAGSASGLTGLFGYIGMTCSGKGVAYVAGSSYGWNGALTILLIASCAGAICFLFTWNARSRSLESVAPVKQVGKAA